MLNSKQVTSRKKERAIFPSELRSILSISLKKYDDLQMRVETNHGENINTMDKKMELSPTDIKYRASEMSLLNYLDRHFPISSRFTEEDLINLGQEILNDLPYITENELYAILSYVPTTQVAVYSLLSEFSNKQYSDQIKQGDMRTLNIILDHLSKIQQINK